MYCWGWLLCGTIRHAYCTVAHLVQMLNQVLRVKVQPKRGGLPYMQPLIKGPRGIKCCLARSDYFVNNIYRPKSTVTRKL